MQGRTAHIGPTQPLAPAVPPAIASDTPSSTLLTDMPQDATLDIWLKPFDKTILDRVASSEHISDLVAQGETVLLLSFADVVSDASTMMANAFARAKELNVPVLMLIGSNAENFLAASIFWSRGGSILHRREEVRGREVVFSPSRTLLQLLGIGRRGTIKTRNALVLIDDHRIVASWVDPYDGGIDTGSKMMPTPHDWTAITAAMAKI
jgi:hypothetical protein